MLKKKLTLLTALSLAASLALAGCGTASSNSGSTGEAEEAAAEEAADIEEAGEETAEIEETVEEEESAPEEEVPEEPVSYNIADLSTKQENMLGPMDTIATCQTEDGPTDYEDSEEVWTAVYLLVMNYSDLFEGRIEYEDNYLYVTEDVLDECASAMFADFDGTLPEGDMGSITKDGDRYCLPGSDRGDSYARISSWTENPDGTCTVEIQELIESEHEVTQEYRIELVENKYAGTEEDALFVYSVASVEQTFQKEWDESEDEEETAEATTAVTSGSTSNETADQGTWDQAADQDTWDEAADQGTWDETADQDTWDEAADQGASDDSYVLPGSDSRYYTEDELSSLSKDELRLARNEIYARHGRSFDSEDLQSYFDSQEWYEGSVAPEDFSYSVFNDYEKENIRAIEEAEEAAGD